MWELEIIQYFIVEAFVCLLWFVVGGKYIFGMDSLVLVQFFVDTFLNGLNSLGLSQQVNEADN